MAIPYIKAERNQNIINCNADLIVMHNRKPVMVSLVDISLSVKKVFSDMIRSRSQITVYDREDIFYERELSVYSESFRYKLTKHDNKNTHGMLYNTNQNNYLFDWNNEGLVKSLTKFLSTKHFLPVSENIVEKTLKLQDEYIQFISECDVLTSQEQFEELKVWYVHVALFKELLEQVKFEDDGFNWNKIEDTTDYLVEFINPIMNKIHENVEILYDENKIHPKMNEGIKLFEGQKEIVQGGIEVLNSKQRKFLYLAAEQGSGKSIMGSKINHLYHDTKGKNNYITMVVAPTITLKQWAKEIKRSVAEDVDVIIITKTDQFIHFHRKTNMKVDKPTYILVGKETFKLSYQVRKGINVKRKQISYIEEDKWGLDTTITKTMEVCTCPDCGLALKNEMRKKKTVFFTSDDFDKPKKSNYKCGNCDSVLFQAEYNKTKKTSIVDYIKKQKIMLDSIIVDEIHQSNNAGSILGNATRVVMRHAKKIIMLSGTVTNGYASSIYNVLFSLLPNKLRKYNVFEKDEFVKMYGTLVGTSLIKDSELYKTSRIQVRDSQMKEIEGINPIIFTEFFLENFIFSTLSDIAGDNLPKINEHFISVKGADEQIKGETKLLNDIKQSNALNAAFYNDSIVKHYTNNPFDWLNIPITKKTENGTETKLIQPTNIKEQILPKEQVLIELCKKEKSLNRKVWVYTDFVTNGSYKNGTTLQNRLKSQLESAGLNVYVLTSNTTPINRIKQLEKNKDQYDVFISNSSLISVGVNLQWCPNYVFYTPTYKVNDVRQSMKRGLRINSTVDNNVFFLHYDFGNELEINERFKLKYTESSAIEGKFVDVGADVKTASKLSSKINKELSGIKV